MYFVYVIDIKRNDKNYSLTKNFNANNDCTENNENFLFNSKLSYINVNNVINNENLLENDNYDCDELPSHWTTCRKYDEIFLLEEKMRDYYGNALRFDALPDQKNFLKVLNKKYFFIYFK